MTYIYIGILVCIILSAFFSAAEMSYSACSRMRLESARDAGNKKAAAALKITDNFDDALSAILIGNNLANIAGSSLGSIAVMKLLGDGYAWVSTLCITLLVIVFGETIPKICAKKTSNSSALRIVWPVRFVMIILYPLVWVVVKLIYVISIPFKGEADETPEEAVEELQSIIEQAEDESVLDEERSELVQAAIDFNEVCAYEVMTSRVDVLAIDIEDAPEEIDRIVEESGYSRLPVYDGTFDNIIGILYLNHYLRARADGEYPDIRSMLMEPCYVYKTMKLPDLMDRFRKAKQHLAIVVDEYGGNKGVVSMEDVLETLVGDIWDENDEVEEEVVERSDGEYELDGDMAISDFIELMEFNEDDFDFESDTVGGWTVEQFGGEFPAVGNSFRYEDIYVEVISMDGRRVNKVFVKKLGDKNNDD